MKNETNVVELKQGPNQLKRGRWYGLGDHEIAVTETTIRGIMLKTRPRIDKSDEERIK